MTIRLTTLLAALLISVSQFAYADNMQDVVAKRKAMAADKPYSSVVPRSNEPTGELTVLALWPYEPDMRFAVAALQGIVNREQPRVYIGYDKVLRWMQYHSGKVTVKGVYDTDKLFEIYKDKVKGLIIYDDQFDAGLNIAITYAGIEDLIPVTPALAETFTKKFGWKVVHDLRGRWTDRVEAYKWAFDNLRPKCTDYALMHFKFAHIPNDGTFEAESWRHQVAHSVDYAVMARMFVWHIAGEPAPGEMELANRIMESVPFYTPVFGASSGKMLAEPVFVTYVSTYANLHIPLYSPNVSVLSGVRIPDDQLKRNHPPVPAREIDPNKIYIAFTNSEHDNMGHVIGGGVPWKSLGFETDDPYKMWWADPMRGKVPIGWPIGPLLCELAPPILARMTMTATDNDYFMAALSGISLTNIPDYGAAYPGMEDELAAGYAKLTGEYLNRLGWTMINPWSGPGTLRLFTENIPNLEGIFEGYGRHPGVTYEKASYLLNGVPVFHNLTKGSVGTSRNDTISESYAIKSKGLVDQIKEVKLDERPAFMHVWTMGWDFSPTILKMVADQLPPEYVVVRPDELAAMFKQNKESQAKINSNSIMIKASGNVTETPNGDSELIIDTGKIKVEIGWGDKAQPPIKRVMGVDGKWRGSGRLLHDAKGQTVTSFTCKKLKDSGSWKQYLLKYIFSNGGFTEIKLTALMGRPYLLVEETISMKRVPTWSFSVYDGFEPDTCWSDKQIEPIDYKGSVEKGKLPWSSWLMAGKMDGSERDMIGMVSIDWDKWNNGQIVFRQRDNGADFESYYYRSGIKRFAIAALDKNDSESPKKIYQEINKE